MRIAALVVLIVILVPYLVTPLYPQFRLGWLSVYFMVFETITGVILMAFPYFVPGVVTMIAIAACLLGGLVFALRSGY